MLHGHISGSLHSEAISASASLYLEAISASGSRYLDAGAGTGNASGAQLDDQRTGLINHNYARSLSYGFWFEDPELEQDFQEQVTSQLPALHPPSQPLCFYLCAPQVSRS